MEYKILNRVSKSKIKTIDFNDFITIYNYEIIEENKFKYTFDKINENFTVYYGFQKKRLK